MLGAFSAQGTKRKRKVAKKTSFRNTTAPPHERTVQHLRLPDRIRDNVRKRAKRHGVTMNEIQDEACTWFLKNKARRAYTKYFAPTREGAYRSLWINSRIHERLRYVADRDYVPIARVIYTALTLYLEETD